MKLRTIGCFLFLGLVGATQAVADVPPPTQGKSWTSADVTRLAGLEPAMRRAELKAMNPADRRGLWFEVMRQVRANQGVNTGPVTRGSASATYAGSSRGSGKRRVGFDKSAPLPNAVGTIQYDDGAGSTTFGGGAIIGNKFDTAGGAPIFASGSVDTVQAVVAQGPANTTSSAGFVLLGPQTGGGGALALFSTFTNASGVTDTLTFTGLGQNYTGNSFFVLFGDFANSYVPVFGTGTNDMQGHHGVVGYTGGMGPNITGTFDFGGALNGLVRATGNVLPLELTDLAISKTDGATSSIAGGSVTYTIVGSNAGPGDASGASVTDTFPAELSTCNWTCVGANGGTCTGAGAGNINDLVNLPNLASVTYTATCTVSPSAVPGSSVSNTAVIAAAVPANDPDPINNTATDVNGVLGSTDLAITKTDGATTSIAGGSVTYTIVASNAGPSTATGATVADMFPAQLTSCSWSCVGAGGGTCTAAGSGSLSDTVNLPSLASVTYTASCTVDPSAGPGSTISNTASITVGSTSVDPNSSNNTATDVNTVGSPASITATKTVAPLGGGLFSVGGEIAYTIVISNAGPASQTDNAGDEFVDPLPAGLSFGSVTATSGLATFDAVSNAVTWNGSIAAGNSVTITIIATITSNASTSIVNQGTANFDADGNGTNESSTVTDNPTTTAPGDATGFFLSIMVPGNAPWALLLLACLTLVTVWVRRR